VNEQESEQPRPAGAEDIRIETVDGKSVAMFSPRGVLLERLGRGDNVGAIAVALLYVGDELATIRNVLISIDESLPTD